MVLKIRLARFGKRNAPFYNIVVAQARYVDSPLPSLSRFKSTPFPQSNLTPPCLLHKHSSPPPLTNHPPQNCPRFQTPRSPRHLRPHTKTAPTRRGQAVQRYKAGHVAGEVLVGGGGAAERAGVEVAEYGRFSFFALGWGLPRAGGRGIGVGRNGKDRVEWVAGYTFEGGKEGRKRWKRWNLADGRC